MVLCVVDADKWLGLGEGIRSMKGVGRKRALLGILPVFEGEFTRDGPSRGDLG